MDGGRVLAAVVALSGVLASLYVVYGPNHERRKKSKYRVVGLQNLGNSCFLNVVLQAMAACPRLVRWLRAASEAGRRQNPFAELVGRAEDRPSLAAVLLEVIRAINGEEGNDVDAHDPAKVMQALFERRWVISSDQQDAHEMLHCLTSSLEEDLTSRRSISSLINVGELEGHFHPVIHVGISRTRAVLPVLSVGRDLKLPFRGLLASQLRCRACSFRHPIKLDTFDSISLIIPRAYRGLLTLQGCLREYVMSEQLQDVECENCTARFGNRSETFKDGISIEQSSHLISKKVATFIKQLTIGKLPETLCIHIQRMEWLETGVPCKRNDYINFPEVLRMDEFLYSPTMESGTRRGERCGLLNGGSIGSRLSAMQQQPARSSVLYPHSSLLAAQSTSEPNGQSKTTLVRVGNDYELKAVIIHLGDVYSGHFVTYRQSAATARQHHRWFYCSDTLVREVSLQEVLQTDAYMLFYERLERKVK